MKTCPCNVQRFFISETKQKKFHWKNFDIFLIFVQNIDCGYTLEPPRRAVLTSTRNLCFGSKINRYTPANPQFVYIKVGFKGVYISRTCFPNNRFLYSSFQYEKEEGAREFKRQKETKKRFDCLRIFVMNKQKNTDIAFNFFPVLHETAFTFIRMDALYKLYT